MTSPARVHLHTLADLRQAASITVRWQVVTPIGPGWIGGGRTVQFQVDGAELDDACAVHAALEAILITAFAIPDHVDAACISGFGDLQLRGFRAELDWEATASVPYGHVESTEGLTRLTELERALQRG
jgi:hypothetical protein